MENLNNIQKVNLELKNYANRIKAQNLLNPSPEILNSNFLENNQVKSEILKKVRKIEMKNPLTYQNSTQTNQFLPFEKLEGNTKNNRIQLNRKGKVSVNSNKNPIFLISKNIHRHIKSYFNFNSELAKNNTILFNFNKNNKKFNSNSLLENSFLNLGNVISKPVLFITPNKITINLFYYVLESEKNYKLINESENLQYLCSFLSNKFKKAVELDLIRLHQPSLESKILANTIGFISKNKKVRFRSIVSSLFNNTQILKLNVSSQESNFKYCRPTALVGIKINLGGRISSQKVVPRFTTVSKQQGAFARNKSDFATLSRFTDKSRRGAFSFTVTVAHKSF
jgi:hypothetical protein